jgi:hypothetical protein
MAAMLISPPPPPDCPLGARFEFLENWSRGFEAEVHVRSYPFPEPSLNLP